MIASLLWKEWREQRWIALGIFAVYAALVGMACGVSGRDRGEIAQGCIFAMSFLVPGFVAMGTITHERSRRTEETLRALPVDGVLVAMARLAGGIFTMSMPLVAVQAICWLGGLHADYPSPAVILLSEMGLMLSLYLWTLLLGARMRSEVALGLGGVGLLAGCALAAVAWDVMFYDVRQLRHWPLYGLPTGFSILGPLTPEDARPEPGITMLIAVLQIFEIVPLLFFVAWRLSVPALSSSGHIGVSRNALAPWIAVGQRYPVLWKSWREVRVLVLGFIAGTLFIGTACTMLFWWRISDMRAWSINSDEISLGAALIVVLPGMGAFLVTILMAVDIGTRDFENKLDRFWLSRPISPAAYMMKRVLIGLLILAPVLLLVPMMGWTLLVATGIFHPSFEFLNLGRGAWPSESNHYALLANEAAENGAMFLVLYAPRALVVYAGTILFATLSRRRVISMVMGIAIALGLQMLAPPSESVASLTASPPVIAYVIVHDAIMVALAGVFGGLTMASIQYDWRSWFERKLQRNGAPVSNEAVAGR